MWLGCPGCSLWTIDSRGFGPYMAKIFGRNMIGILASWVEMVRAHRSSYYWVAHYDVYITVQAKGNAKRYGWQWAAEEKKKLAVVEKLERSTFRKGIFEWCRISKSYLRDFLLHVCPAPSIWDIEVDGVKDPEYSNGTHTHRHIKACKTQMHRSTVQHWKIK